MYNLSLSLSLPIYIYIYISIVYMYIYIYGRKRGVSTWASRRGANPTCPTWRHLTILSYSIILGGIY